MTVRIRTIAIPVVVLLAGAAVTFMLVASRRPPVRKAAVQLGPLVEAVAVHPADVPVIIHGTGTARSPRTVQIIPQVSGRIVETSPAFTQGGYFRAGEVLVRIDPTDYEAALHQAEARVTTAEVALEMERARALVARREWDRQHPGKEPPSPLVVHEPQVQQAEAELAAAKAALEKAKVDLERTRIALPFDGRIVEKKADVGQFVAPGQVVASAYGVETMEIPVPLRDDELAWFDIPCPGNRRNGSAVTITARLGGETMTWRGRIARTEGTVDLKTRTIAVVVEVPRPVGGTRIPLLPGMFVDVAIEGRVLEGAYAIPRYAIHEGGTVWVADGGRLRFRPVTVAHTAGDTAYVTRGLEDGDLVVTSQLEVVTDGMKVRVADGTGHPGDAAGSGEPRDA